MHRVSVTMNIVKQLVTWARAVISWLLHWCAASRRRLRQNQQRWETRSTILLSRVCRSLPLPLRTPCTRAADTAGALVPVLFSVLTVLAQAGCVAATVASITLLLALLSIVITLLVLLCIVVPGGWRAESPLPPDSGWLVTLGGAGSARLSRGNTVRLLPDGEPACLAMLADVALARQTIHVLQLDFERDFIVRFVDADATSPPHPTEGAQGPVLLRHALLDAAKRGVRIRILLNDNAFEDSLPKLRAMFAGVQNVELAGLLISPHRRLGMMHAKALIVDGATAFVVGLPFAQGYLDTQQHWVIDQRRGSGAGGHFPPLGDVGNGVGKKPAHTVSLRLGGPAASSVDGVFSSLWNSVSSEAIASPPAVPGTGTQSIQVVLSAPPLSAAGLAGGEKGILEAYLRAIQNAQHFIYLETQYLTSPAIAAALSRALTANPSLELIVLLNENPDMPTYKFWQNDLISRLGAFPGQVGVFTLWRTQPPDQGQPLPRIMQCYVEAKVAVVDDVWATVGSGNLDGPSLGHLFEFLPPPLLHMSSSRSWRNVECNAILYDGIADQPATGEVAALRTMLWREHLGAEAASAGRPEGGWLELWKRIAGQNIVSLNATQTMSGDPLWPSRILPYASALDTAGQLSQVGVSIGMFAVAPAVPR